MAEVILDSNCLIAIFKPTDKHFESISSLLRASKGNSYAISSVTYSESLVHSFQKNEAEFMGERIRTLIDRIYDVDEEVAFKAAEIRATKKVLAPDAFISATAQVHGLTLWTYDASLSRATPLSKLLH